MRNDTIKSLDTYLIEDRSEKSFKKRLLSLLRNQPILLILIVITILASFVPGFIARTNLINIIKQSTIVGIVSLGLTFTMISGNLDLSLGALFSLCGMVFLLLQPYGITISIVGTVLVALIFGSINGYIISKFNLNPIITTLGTSYIIGAFCYIFTRGATILGDTDSLYSKAIQTFIWKVPSYVFVFIGLAIILSIILTRTQFGRNIFMIGTNKEAGKIAGIKVAKITIFAFMVSGLCVAVASIILTSRMAVAYPNSGSDYSFGAITAVLIGGNSLHGGKGGIFNTIVGVLLLGIMGNVMILLNLAPGLQSVMSGALLIIALYIDYHTRGIYS